MPELHKLDNGKICNGVKILIVAGGTGGHIFPAISLANKIKDINSYIDVVFCVDKRVDKKLLEKLNYKYYILDAPRMPYGISLKWIPFLIKLLFSFSKPIKILDEIDPDIVVGFGAYISGLILLRAKKNKKKIIIHEQNIIFGRANLLLLKMADRVALGFDSMRHLHDNRYVITGNPIRTELLEDLEAMNKERACALLGLSATKKTVLVMGGSLGSRRINEIFLNMLKILPAEILDSLQIIHLTSKDDFDNVQYIYKGINVEVKLYPFFERIGLLYKASDFAICRAGAITISELCAFGVPAVLIPYPGAGAHQAHNARYLQEKEAAIVMEEKHLTQENFKTVVLSLLADGEKFNHMSNNIKALAKVDAAEKLAEVVIKAC